MYEIKNGKPFYYSLLILKHTFHIPENIEKSYLRNFWIKFATLKLYCMLAVGVLPILHFIMNIKDNTGVDVTEDLTFSISDTGVLLVCILYTLQYKKWSEFFTEITVVMRFEDFKNVEKFARKSNRFSILSICYILFATVLYFAISLSGSSECKQLNQEKGLHEACVVYFSIWLPFDANDIYSSFMVVALQLVVVNHLMPGIGMICFLILESAEMLILHIDILKEEFVHLFEGTANQEIYDKLRFIINYHNRILRLGECYGKLGKHTIGIQSFISTIVIGCMLNQTLNSKPVGALVYMVGYVIVLFFICHAGQRISDQTMSLGDAVFASNWHRADPKTMKDLAFVILRSQKPIYLNAFPLGTYNYALFAAILKTSYSYMTLLQQTT